MPALPRRTGVASVATVGAMTLALTVAHAAAPEWTRAAGLDVWNYEAAAADYQDATARADELAANYDVLTRQFEAADAMADRLAAGRVTLAAAAAELEDINRHRSGFDTVLAGIHRDAATPRARVARYAIAKVRLHLAADPSRLAEVEARLEAEYRAMSAEAAEVH